MNNKKSTKRTLLTSVLSLVLCMAMLIGTTFAWFTDSVTSSNNKIQAGNLDVQLLMNTGSGYSDISNSTSPIFGAGSIAQNDNSATLWEPGKTQVAYLAIKNNGSLDLKYTVALDVKNVTKNLDKVMEYVITPDAQYDSVKAWNNANAKQVVLGKQTVSNGEGTLKSGDTHYFALSVHMMESADNKYQNGTIDFDMTILATQLASEYDSFDNQYDAGAQLPVYAQAASQAELAAAISDGANTVQLAEGTYKLPATTNNDITLVGNGDTVIDMSYATGQALSGTDVTLENLTVTGSNNDYTGLQHVGNVVYNNVVFNNSTNLYGESVTFNDCTFNLTSRYIWTYGAGVATFNNCTFYTEGKAILAYKESDPATYTVNINDCTFYATKAGYTGSGDQCAAVEIDSSLVGAYVINFNGTNTVSKNFVGLYRIKSQKDPANATVNQNGIVVATDLMPVSDGLFTDPDGNYYVENANGLISLHDEIDPTWGTDDLNGKSINIMTNIDATGKTWNTINMNTGSTNCNGFVFNGNGYTISNLIINGSGLFEKNLNNGTGSATVFQNVTFDNVTVNGGWHTGVVWGQAYGDIELNKVNVINSNITGTCNVGALVGRNGDDGAANIKFVDCSVKNTVITSTGGGDNCGASAFLGMALKTGAASVNLVFEGSNVVENNTLTSATGQQGGGIYAKATWGEASWDTPDVVSAFENYNCQ